jgi:hypothetical protein
MTVIISKLSRVVIAWILAFGVVELGVIRFFFPSHFTPLLFLILPYFCILGILMLLILRQIKRRKIHPGRAVARLMLFNVSQMLLSVMIVIVYSYFIDIERYTMLLAFSIFYIFFMGIKFFIIYNIDRRHKLTKENEMEYHI